MAESCSLCVRNTNFRCLKCYLCQRFLTNISEPITGRDWFIYFQISNFRHSANKRQNQINKEKKVILKIFQTWNANFFVVYFNWNMTIDNRKYENGTQILLFKRNQQVTPIGCPFWKIERPKAYWPIDRLRLAAAGRGGADDLMALRHSHCLRKTLISASITTYCNRCIDMSLYFFTIGR